MGFRLAVLAAAAAVLLPPAAGVAAERAFLAAVEDLPLAPGLVETPEAGLVFDTPAGRIVEAHAEGAVPASEVEAFYAEALPELGWRRRGPWRFGREDEVLVLEVSPTGRGIAVRFTLQPER
jgi:hypothetical protein